MGVHSRKSFESKAFELVDDASSNFPVVEVRVGVW